MEAKIITNALNALLTEKYSYNPLKSEWKLGKDFVEEWEVQAFVIRWARDNTTIRAKGTFAERVIAAAKQSPEFTYQAFVKKRTCRDRNRRLAGKHLFESWCNTVGIEIEGTLEDFVRKNNKIAARFYALLDGGVNEVRKRARIVGKLFCSVFMGWSLVDDEEISVSLPMHSDPIDPLRIPRVKNSTRVQKRHRWRLN